MILRFVLLEGGHPLLRRYDSSQVAPEVLILGSEAKAQRVHLGDFGGLLPTPLSGRTACFSSPDIPLAQPDKTSYGDGMSSCGVGEQLMAGRYWRQSEYLALLRVT